MPEIPLQKTQTVFSDRFAPYQQINADPNAFGASVGQGLSNVGQGLDQAGGQLNNIVQMQAEAQHTEALNKLTQASIDLISGNPDTGQVGYRTLQGKNAIDAFPDYRDKMQQSFDDLRSQMNPMVARMFDNTGQRILRGALDTMATHNSQQAVVYNHTEARGSVAVNQDAAIANADDPGAWAHFLGMTQDASLRSSQIAGLGADAAEETRKKDLSLVYEKRVDQLALRDPMSAATFYNDNIGMIDPEKRYNIEKMLKTVTDTQYSKGDGYAAYKDAIGRPEEQATQASPLPQNKNAPIVKPYDQQRIDQIIQQVKAPSKYDDLFDKYGKMYNVNPTELKLRATAESDLNPNAVSSQGASGLMQFMPATAKSMKIDPKDPEQSIAAAAKYIASNGGTIGGDMESADRAYYGGKPTSKGPNTDQYAENLKAVRNQLYGPSAVAPMTTTDLESKEADVIKSAESYAEQRRPGDPAYRDQVVSEAHKNWARDVQALRGQDMANFSKVGDFVTKNGVTSASELPPEMQQTLSKLNFQNYDSIKALFNSNIRAANGEFTKSDPKLVNDLRQRIYLSDGDPQKITNMSQVYPYIAHGLNYTDTEHLEKEIKDANNPETNQFLKQVNGIKTTGRKMLTQSYNALQAPEIAEEAAYRFSNDLDQKVLAYRKAGKDPQDLFTPGKPDYVLDPNRVASFMPNEQQVATYKANVKAEAKQPIKVASDDDYAKLPSGSVFIDPTGKRRRKP